MIYIIVTVIGSIYVIGRLTMLVYKCDSCDILSKDSKCPKCNHVFNYSDRAGDSYQSVHDAIKYFKAQNNRCDHCNTRLQANDNETCFYCWNKKK